MFQCNETQNYFTFPLFTFQLALEHLQVLSKASLSINMKALSLYPIRFVDIHMHSYTHAQNH